MPSDRERLIRKLRESADLIAAGPQATADYLLSDGWHRSDGCVRVEEVELMLSNRLWEAKRELDKYPLVGSVNETHWGAYVKSCQDSLDAFRALSAQQEADERPEIVCLCGSSRFTPEMAILAWEFEKDGKIVLGLHLLPDWYEPPDGKPLSHEGHQAEMEGVAEHMDELHLRKIDLADRVFVVNPDGYIGDSTRREIAYAMRTGKPVVYLEQPEADERGKPNGETQMESEAMRTDAQANKAAQPEEDATEEARLEVTDAPSPDVCPECLGEGVTYTVAGAVFNGNDISEVEGEPIPCSRCAPSPDVCRDDLMDGTWKPLESGENIPESKLYWKNRATAAEENIKKVDEHYRAELAARAHMIEKIRVAQCRAILTAFDAIEGEDSE